MDLASIQTFLEQNKDQEDVKAYIEGLSKVTPDGVKAFLETDEGKEFIQPKLDSFYSKGLETWKKNHLPGLISEEIAKVTSPNETPDQKRIRELEEKIQKAEQEKIHEQLKNKALATLNEKQLPTFLTDQLIGKDEESTVQNLSMFEEAWAKQVQSVKDEILKENGTSIDEGFSSGGDAPDFFSVIRDNQSRK